MRSDGSASASSSEKELSAGNRKKAEKSQRVLQEAVVLLNATIDDASQDKYRDDLPPKLLPKARVLLAKAVESAAALECLFAEGWKGNAGPYLADAQTATKDAKEVQKKIADLLEDACADAEAAPGGEDESEGDAVAGPASFAGAS